MASVISANRGATHAILPWIASCCLLTSVIAVYWNALQTPFLFDDAGAVVNNATIRHLGSWAVLNPPADGSTVTHRPVVNFSYALNYAFGGLKVWSYHAVNVVIHALAALALMGIVRRTLLQPALGPRFGSSALELAVLAAAGWALHPLQTEAVICIAQRTEVLCGLFFLLTLYGFLRGAVRAPDDPKQPDRCHRGWLGVSCVACLFGMATKEVMATAPLIVFLYDRTFVAGSFSGAWRQRRVYYATLVSTWLLLGLLVASGGGARGASAGFGLGASWQDYLLKQCEAIVLYLRLSLWPHPLVLDYGTGVVHSLTAVWWQGIVVLALLAATFWALARKPLLGFAGAWFFLILAPSSSVIPLVTQTMAEHRMYLPLVPIIVLVVLELFGRFGRTAIWLLGFLIAMAAAATFARSHDYRDEIAIWRDNVDKYPRGARGHNNLASALQQQGKTEESNQEFARAIALEEGYVTARYAWGASLLAQGRLDEAITQLEIAVKLAPNHADAHVNLGNALMRVQREADAIPHYKAALALNPAADAYYNLGVALVTTGHLEDAAAQFRAALSMNPSLSGAHYQLARLAERAGQPADAEAHYSETLRLTPNDAAAHAQFGLMLARAGELAKAREHLEAAVQLKPEDADAHANLGNVLLFQGRVPEAITRYEEALRLRPDDLRTRENLRLARESLR